MTPPQKRRARHAASRARKLTAVLSVFSFVAIGQAINLAARTATSAQTGTVAQSAVPTPSFTSASKRSASASTPSITTTAVTSTHAS